MRKLNILIVLGLCAVLLPAVASAGDVTGACYVVEGITALSEDATPEGKFAFAGCADDFTEEECSSIDELTQFAAGATCADLAQKGGFDWDGSCLADIDPLGNICIQLWTEIDPEFTQELCENDIGGVWSDDLTCGAPVPTMPGFGMAFMALVILGGALILLTVRGSLPSA